MNFSPRAHVTVSVPLIFVPFTVVSASHVPMRWARTRRASAGLFRLTVSPQLTKFHGLASLVAPRKAYSISSVVWSPSRTSFGGDDGLSGLAALLSKLP